MSGPPYPIMKFPEWLFDRNIKKPKTTTQPFDPDTFGNGTLDGTKKTSTQETKNFMDYVGGPTAFITILGVTLFILISVIVYCMCKKSDNYDNDDYEFSPDDDEVRRRKRKHRRY